MQRHALTHDQLSVAGTSLWLNQWLLLTSGTMERFNCMTVAWGSIGGMWGKPFVQVVVRPTRYTYEFMEQYASFSVCAFPTEYKKDLSILGSKSGRDGDKLAETALTPEAASRVEAPTYKEAELSIECRKLYWQDFDPTHFLDPALEKNYLNKDYHRAYFGEIVALNGSNAYTDALVK
ncbi:MAG: flavin reductase family protein [Chitinivibrionales bacterium]|nr:flavin reductase family protein [Chitinivibrionales bacterium]